MSLSWGPPGSLTSLPWGPGPGLSWSPQKKPAWPLSSPAPPTGGWGAHASLPQPNKSCCSLQVAPTNDLLPINSPASMFSVARCRPQFRTVCWSAAGEGRCGVGGGTGHTAAGGLGQLKSGCGEVATADPAQNLMGTSEPAGGWGAQPGRLLPQESFQTVFLGASDERPWRRKWHPTPVVLPGKSHGQRSLVDYSQRVGHD